MFPADGFGDPIYIISPPVKWPWRAHILGLRMHLPHKAGTRSEGGATRVASRASATPCVLATTSHTCRNTSTPQWGPKACLGTKKKNCCAETSCKNDRYSVAELICSIELARGYNKHPPTTVGPSHVPCVLRRFCGFGFKCDQMSKTAQHTPHTPHTAHRSPHTAHHTPHVARRAPHTTHTAHHTRRTTHRAPHAARTPHTAHHTPHAARHAPHTPHTPEQLSVCVGHVDLFQDV